MQSGSIALFGFGALPLALGTLLVFGPPGAPAVGGVSPIARGEVAWFEVDLQPGRYALICFLPDAKDGKPHVAHGRVQELVVGADQAVR